MRKYLGVLAGVVALGVMSWAQAPTPAPTTDQTAAQTPAQEPTPIPTPPPAPKPLPAPEYPRIELFGGGSYAEAGLYNAGHWAGLPGWDASLAGNVASWLGFVVEGGEFFGTSKIPSSSPAPFPGNQTYEPVGAPTFNVSTREYNFLFGAQFARRKYGMWTPFGELLYGHQGVRGVATPVIPGPLVAEVGTGRALVAGFGGDRKINQRFAIRFKADYFQTGTNFPSVGKQKQDNFRVSVGVVIRNVHKKKRTLEDETQIEQ
ncbi:MAG: hypothetical protein WCF61_13250 [Terriglobales bacterium]